MNWIAKIRWRERLLRKRRQCIFRDLFVSVAALTFGAAPCLAQQAPGPQRESAPGTVITNQAQVVVSTGATTGSFSSNIVALTVAERLDVMLQRSSKPTYVTGNDSVIPALLTNTGSGTEAFQLAASVGDDRDDHAVRVYVDVDGDGILGAGDEVLAEAQSPALAPGEQRALLFVVRDAPPAASITPSAAALTGSGAPGTTFDGRGDGGGDAVVGQSGARAQLAVAVPGSDAAATLTKSQQVRDRRGGTVAEPGATITYTLIAAFPAAASGAVVSDPVPVGTTLLPESITLDGVALTDRGDSDAGEVREGAINVALGSVAAGATHTITFRVTIQ